MQPLPREVRATRLLSSILNPCGPVDLSPILSGELSVNRTTRSRDNCSTSALGANFDDVPARLLKRATARCFPLAFSLSGICS